MNIFFFFFLFSNNLERFLHMIQRVQFHKSSRLQKSNHRRQLQIIHITNHAQVLFTQQRIDTRHRLTRVGTSRHPPLGGKIHRRGDVELLTEG